MADVSKFLISSLSLSPDPAVGAAFEPEGRVRTVPWATPWGCAVEVTTDGMVVTLGCMLVTLEDKLVTRLGILVTQEVTELEAVVCLMLELETD